VRAVLVALLVCSAAAASDRVSMVDNSETTSIKDLVAGVVRAFDSEDLDSYASFFKESRRSYIRRRSAHVFADDECSMELVDIHIIEDDGENAAAAVKYRMGGASASFVILAEVDFVKEEGEWRIDRETVKSKSLAPSRTSMSSAPAIPIGRAPIWDPLNPDPDKISPNLNHLIGDVGIQQGMGCADGKCRK
jgi:hypothetical protein